LKSLCRVRIIIMATMPERKSTIISELTIENQWICSSPAGRRGREGGHELTYQNHEICASPRGWGSWRGV
jgi:hypothetical protein